IGYAVGDVIEWPVPGGTRRIRIEQILYQPEAAGDFHL
ncbi:MAG TPA: transcription elongation factor GreAB, partial [Acidobacteriota bacterium]|nr:transcription elongation factor GreAB [Acidobacteriota bacterium]